MAKTIALIIVVFISTGPVMAQRRPVGDWKDTVRMDRGRPSVYLEFVKAGVCYASETTTVESWSPCETTHRSENSQGYDAVWLRLRNNSRWSINFDALSLYVWPIAETYRLGNGKLVTAIRDGAEIRARHRVEAEIAWEQIETPTGREYKLVDVKAPIVNRVTTTTSRVWLPPRRSVVFVVKREHLAKYLLVYLPYKYQWDGDQNDLVSIEPHHRVYFSWYSLQKALDTPQTCLAYEPNPVVLNGTIRRRTFAGPPKYESVATGDLREQVWLLHLDQPICVSATAEWNMEENISELQLVFANQQQYRRHRSLVDRQVSVSGTLFHATTGHHHTKVLLTVSRIQKRQQEHRNRNRDQVREIDWKE